MGTSSLEDRTITDDLAKTVLAGIGLIESGYEGDYVECIAQIGVSYFIEIARLRALQILWQNTMTALERNRPDLVIEAHFADRDMSDDQYINMISASTKALSAICGGADRLVIAPSSPDASDFHRRISRNVHHLLKFETKLDSVMDPVAGSFYIEGMVNQFASEAWAKVLSALD